MTEHQLVAPWSPPHYVTARPYAERFRLAPADKLTGPIFLTGLTKHHAVYLGLNHAGQETVAENDFIGGVREVLASDYFARYPRPAVDKFLGNDLQRAQALRRARSTIGQPYDLLAFNCEHYASYVQTGRAESKQVNNVLLGMRVLIAILLIVLLFPTLRS